MVLTQVQLTPFTKNDFDAYQSLMTQAHIQSGLQINSDHLADDFLADLSQPIFNQVVYEKQCIGFIILYEVISNDASTHYQLAFGLDAKFQHQGYMLQALSMQLAHIQPDTVIQAEVLPENHPSLSLLAHLNFTKLGQVQDLFGQQRFIFEFTIK
ncbi:GNAT family N-acetyltransferase [Weissella minor]|uniref:N-acetyltransferase domain-containing protein n=1 Tax=Weissella minor TaxID=1620 RepID=A0A0R2JG00_9LACO|nr:GNAT family N-acetyltransferase [Weissella minor]KRN76251.1 hypothetical protein IV67_GL000827 [Weissella minor]